jgi:hypothetical protein
MVAGAVTLDTVGKLIPPNVLVNSKGERSEHNVSKNASGMTAVALTDLVHILCQLVKENQVINAKGQNTENNILKQGSVGFDFLRLFHGQSSSILIFNDLSTEWMPFPSFVY